MKVRNKLKWILISGWLGSLYFSAAPLKAQQSSKASGKKAVLVIKPTTDFNLTGDTLGVSWSGTPWLNLSLRDPSKSIFATKVKMLYSDKGIYCLYWCEDHKITATLQNDFDNIFNEDVVEIFFWTDEKYPIYFEYELSPLNKELAILVPNMKGSFLGWRPWHYEGERLTRHIAKIKQHGDAITGWVAEFFIPFALLKPLTKVPPAKGTTWRVNMYRIDYDADKAHWWWQPIRTNFHDYKSFGTLKFE